MNDFAEENDELFDDVFSRSSSLRLSERFSLRALQSRRARSVTHDLSPEFCLRDAIRGKDHGRVKTVFAGGTIDVNRPLPTGENLLHVAVDTGCEKIVQVVLDQGADVQARDSSGWTALHCIEPCITATLRWFAGCWTTAQIRV